MNSSRSIMRGAAALLVCLAVSASSFPAQDEKTDENLMVREAGNPVTSLINLPVQENISFGIGEHDRTMHVIKIQPIRFSLRASSVHRLRSRTIIPLI